MFSWLKAMRARRQAALRRQEMLERQQVEQLEAAERHLALVAELAVQALEAHRQHLETLQQALRQLLPPLQALSAQFPPSTTSPKQTEHPMSRRRH